jgi:hypothetical protein
MKSLARVLMVVAALFALFAAQLICPDVADAQVARAVVNPPGLFNRTVVRARGGGVAVANVGVGHRGAVLASVNAGQTVLLAPQTGFVSAAAFVPTAAFTTSAFVQPAFVPTGFGSLAVSNGVFVNPGFVGVQSFGQVRSLGVCSAGRCR